MLAIPVVTQGGLPAFPGAEGYGAIASGGRGGTVYHVTTLADAGAGSFRDAVSQPNRTVVFDVGGIINLSSDVEVVDNITIAGQTAPGQGIATTNATVYLNQALDFARSMPACRIAEEPIRDSISKYSHAAGFQQKMTDIQSLVATGNYAEAIRELVDNQQDFLNYHLGRFGLEMEGIYDYIRERNNPYLSEKAAMYYLSGENYGEALRFLQLVHDQGFQEYTMKGIQNQLGQKIARDDYRKSPQDDALENLAKYNAVKGWFDSFRDSYLDEWHRLVKVAGKAGN